MKVLFTIQHPAHVHFFRHVIDRLKSNGNDVKVLVKGKELSVRLLDLYNIDYTLTNSHTDGILNLFWNQLKYEWNIYQTTRSFDPDVIAAIGEPGVAHISAITESKSVIFTDTEHATLQNKITFPFADSICTPDCYNDEIGPRQTKYPSYHELAYLHPKQFEPNPAVLDEIGIDHEDRFVILRLVSWDAVHDIGHSGIDDIEDVIHNLEKTGVKVFITAEGEVPQSVESNQVDIGPHRMHDLMYYADLYIGEGGTMASESAVLGTPAIFISTLRLGYIDELESKYRLAFKFIGEDRHIAAMDKAISILENYDDTIWNERRENMLEDKIDTSDFIIEQIKNV